MRDKIWTCLSKLVSIDSRTQWRKYAYLAATWTLITSKIQLLVRSIPGMPKKILSISENDALRVTRHMLLENRGFDVVSTANLRETRNALKSGDFDLVILGISLERELKREMPILTRKLGPMLFQLPPNLKADADRLAKFLHALPKDAPAAIEYRNPSWFDEQIYSLMRERNVALCIAESDELAVPEVFTANFAYYRLRKSDYSDTEIEQVEQRLRAAAQQREVYAFLKHEDTPEGAINARKLLQKLRAEG